jgi:F0F1-type ATP synthase gamma subunit
MVCEDILKQEADVVRILYNRFVTAISYKPTIATILSAEVSAPAA